MSAESCSCHPGGLGDAAWREFTHAVLAGRGNCLGPGCLRRVRPSDTYEHFCSEQCLQRDRATAGGVLLGSQEPTFLWVPDYATTSGLEVIEMAKAAGLVLDPWQQLLIMHAFAEDPAGAWLCFEIAIIVSRQNGKGSILEAVELAWLFLFGERLVIHSAHLFETSREHFLRISTLIQMNPEFDRRVRRMREGRGAEEIELMDGARLKFMTRKGGAGRGFTGDKTVMDEAMYLDADMMAAGLPTMATRPNAQIWYTGSAGMRHSTQLGAVRHRAFRRNDPSLMYAEWTANKAVYDEREPTLLVSGDDPADRRTWAKVNPGFGPRPVGRITEDYIVKEIRALGGPHSAQTGTERLGIGDWPEEEAAWAVIGKGAWVDALDVYSEIPAAARVCWGLDANDVLGVTTIAVFGHRADGFGHTETVTRHRGLAWVLPWLLDDEHPDRRTRPVAVLRNGAASSLIKTLQDVKIVVLTPTETEYARACGDWATSFVERKNIRRPDQASMTTAVAGAQKHPNREGGWTWERDVAADQSPLIAGTLAKWGLAQWRPTTGWVASSDDFGRPAPDVPAAARTRRGPSGYASARQAGRVNA